MHFRIIVNNQKNEPKSGMDYEKSATYLKTKNAISKGHRLMHLSFRLNLILQAPNYAFHMD